MMQNGRGRSLLNCSALYIIDGGEVLRCLFVHALFVYVRTKNPRCVIKLQHVYAKVHGWLILFNFILKSSCCTAE